jgi:hypothetical protein
MAKSLVTLKKEATELGLAFSEDVKAPELEAQINTHYEMLESQAVAEELSAAQGDFTESVETRVAVSMGQLAAKAEADARKTKVVIINDNDNRENAHTTLAVVSCGNQYFDLGTVRIPLNDPVEVMVGHLQVLRELRIPQHVHDNQSGLTKVVMRPRYSIQEVDK